MSKVKLVSHAATIAINGSLSTSVDLNGGVLEGVVMSALWTAASISFEGSMDDVNFYEVGSGAAEVTYVAAAGWVISIPSGVLNGAGRYIKIRSGTSIAAVAQLVAVRTLGLLVRA